MTGLAVRIMQSLGLHKDGSKFGLPPFEIEIRRRLFWQLHVLDIRAAEDYGLQSTTSMTTKDLPLHPANVNDADLYPKMTTAPVSSSGFTDMTLALLRLQATDLVIHEAVYPLYKTDVGRTRAYLEDRRRLLREANDRVFGKYFMSNNDSENFIYYAAQFIWKLSLAKGEFLLLFRGWQAGLLDPEEVKDVLDAACTILEGKYECHGGRSLRPAR